MSPLRNPGFGTPGYLTESPFFELRRKAEHECGLKFYWNERALVVGSVEFKHRDCEDFPELVLTQIRTMIAVRLRAIRPTAAPTALDSATAVFERENTWPQRYTSTPYSFGDETMRSG